MTVTGFELAGIVTSGVITAFAILLTMLAAEAVKHRQVADAITHLRWSGIMTFTSFAIMVSLFYKCEVVCWEAMRTHSHTPPASVADQIATRPPTHIVCVTPSGNEVTWEIDNNGMRSRAGRSGQRLGSIRRSTGNFGVASVRTDRMHEQSGATGRDHVIF